MLAGAMAGIAEHLAMYPVDTIKTRMQALAHPGQRVTTCSFALHTGFQIDNHRSHCLLNIPHLKLGTGLRTNKNFGA